LRLTQQDPGASDYRAMSIETQYYSQAHCLFTVPKTEFSPVPDVNGLVVNFALHRPEERAVADSEGFLALVSNASSDCSEQQRCGPCSLECIKHACARVHQACLCMLDLEHCELFGTDVCA